MGAQRVRAWYTKGERARFVPHLDVLRYWERAIRRAGLPLSYSQGFTPHPRLAFAAPLPVGFEAEAEIVDITLDERIALPAFLERLAAQTTPEMTVTAVEEVALSVPSPQSALEWADYRVPLPGIDAAPCRAAAAAFLALDSLEWTEERNDRTRAYDLRARVAALAVLNGELGTRLEMRLRARQEEMARPEQVLAAVFPGCEAGAIVRTGLVLAHHSPAMEAWRRRGRFET